MGRLDDKVAIITGAGDGMGAADARLFAAEGAKVVATDIIAERVEAIAEELRAQGYEAIGLKLDVTSDDDWANAIAATLDSYGRIDILVNNTGLPGEMTSWETTTLDDVRKMLEINTLSQFRGIQSVLPSMKAQGGGSIVNMSSIAGIVALPGINPFYSPSKGANRLMAKMAAADLAASGIRVNSVYPGVIDATEQNRELMENPESIAPFVNAIPMGRVGQAAEVAKAVLFLASDDASYITGAELVVDGGYTSV
ncbi:SDR family NAD(P)-dependent oxidoreductase [Microbacterium sp. No. 7]|uniref:SDR family NAD(P)-dependent oxidoreductase n=1 Tax=Microbacterium sp. No. 7 TaxID=1714373 RepID=UPI0006CF7F26|nr:SDR family oxidoreductase [Microbacterium sp. No. 7]ALJ19285.1 hypothetical protein AOA12_04950 [Microbacterium sp. No. 7]